MSGSAISDMECSGVAILIILLDPHMSIHLIIAAYLTYFSYTVGAFLTHWGRVMHICVGNLPIIGSDNGLSAGRRQAIIWTNAGILLIGPLGTNLSDILTEIITFSFKKYISKCCLWNGGHFVSALMC